MEEGLNFIEAMGRFYGNLRNKTKPITASILISTTNWTADEDGYYYDIEIAKAKAGDRADVFFSEDQKQAVLKCEFSTKVEVYDGAVRIRAKNIPQTILSAEVQVGLLSATGVLHIGGEGGTSSGSVDDHNRDPEAHPDIRDALSKLIIIANEIRGRVTALEVAAGGEVTDNPFAVTFGDLDGITVDGIWQPVEARLAF